MENQLLEKGFVAQFVRQVRELEGILPSRTPTIAEQTFVNYNVEWAAPSPHNAALGERLTMTIEDARKHTLQQMRDYFHSPADYVMLVSAKAGLGKSTSAIQFAQELAEQGYRILYVMPRHDYWEDIVNNPFYQKGPWYHWLPTHANDSFGEAMCRYHKQARSWTSKGHSLMKQCKALCENDGHIKNCPYRRQRYNKAPIVATVHTMLRFGVPQDFDLVFVDELALQSMIGVRTVATKNLETGAGEPYSTLTRKIERVCGRLTNGIELRGKKLFDIIGEELGAVYNEANTGNLPMPPEPEIYHPDDIFHAREYYMEEFLSTALPEMAAWKMGADAWLSRIFLNTDGLNIDRAFPLWDQAPNKIIVMDATARTMVYEHMFQREVHAMNPPVKRRGRVFQLAHKLYGISSVLDKSGPEVVLTKQGRELVTLAHLIMRSKPLEGGKFGRYRNVGIVVYKDAKIVFQAIVGPNRVLHPGGARGTNMFVDAAYGEKVDCVIVLGTPSPSDEAILQMAGQVSYDAVRPENSRIEPFAPVMNGNGAFIPVRTSKRVEYNYINEDGLAPYRYVGGFWNHPLLQELLEAHREDEIVQNLHRGRILTNDCDAWIVSSVATEEVLDGLWSNPSHALNIPNDVPWQAFLEIEEFINEHKSVRAEDLEERFGYSKSWAIHIMRAWADYYGGTLKVDESKSGRGRKPLLLEV